MKRRFFSVLLALSLVLSICVVSAVAAQPTIQNLTTYDRAYAFSEGMAAVVKDGKYGFIDKTGKLVIDYKYDYAEDFSEGYAAVSTGGFWDEEAGYVTGNWGFIDKTGKVVVPIFYDKVWDFSEGLAAVSNGGKVGFVDTTGKVVIPLTYSGGMCEEFSFKEGLAVVTTGSMDSPEFHVIDKTGKSAFEFKYDYASLNGYSEGLLAVAVDGEWALGGLYYLERAYYGAKYGFIDTKGKEVVAPIYDYALDFHDGVAAVNKGDKWGAIDRNGREVVPIIYSDISVSGSNGLICVCNDEGKWGYVDYTGKVVVDFKFDYCINYREGYVTNAIDGKWGALDLTGKTVIPFEYDDMWNFSEGLVRVEKAGKWGFMDAGGNMVIDPVYQAASDFSDGVALVMKDDKFGVIAKTSIPYTAKPTASKVLVNGESVAFDAYNINGNNYFKLRDLAYVLNGTEKQFEVEWDAALQAINLKSGLSYTAVGGEMVTGNKSNTTAYLTRATVYIEGVKVDLTAYNINGNNYFKLRDLGKAFDFGVTWDGTANTIRIDTSSSYTE